MNRHARHPEDNSRRMGNFFHPLSKHKDDVQEKQNPDARCSLRQPYLSDAVVSTKGELL